MILTEDEIEISIPNNVGRKNEKRANKYVLQKSNYSNSEKEKDKLRQTNTKEACDKILKALVHQHIARFSKQVCH